MKQEPQSNIINYGPPANMYTKTEAFDQHLFLSKSEAPMHYGPHYHRQRSFLIITSGIRFCQEKLYQSVSCKRMLRGTPPV